MAFLEFASALGEWLPDRQRWTQCNPKHWCIPPLCLVCLVQTQSNLLEKISSYNTSQFSQLVSTIIVKLWSVESGQSDNYFDEILHRVLTRPDIKCIFHFNGMSVSYICRSL